MKKLYLLILLLLFSTLPAVASESFPERFASFYENFKEVVLCCYIIGFIVTSYFAIYHNPKTNLIRVSIFETLFTDFTFDKLLTRKLLSILYFLVYFLAISNIILSSFLFFLDPFTGILGILFVFLWWLIWRVILEITSTTIKIASNTTELVRQNSQKENK
tara:strand:- start:109 stop:591 length:483 start_codon:yes stop_codon:yes gene_type:complete